LLAPRGENTFKNKQSSSPRIDESKFTTAGLIAIEAKAHPLVSLGFLRRPEEEQKKIGKKGGKKKGKHG
jgi:hypothetical protein